MSAKNVNEVSASLKDVIVFKALELAEEIGWAHVSMSELAGRCDVTLAELAEIVEDKSDVLRLLGRLIDRRVLEAMGGGGLASGDMSERDRLFDVMMERFDVLNDYRGGVCSILEGFRYDPKLAVISCPHLCRSMGWMLEVAGIEMNGFRGALKVAGLTGLYLKTLRVWRDDDSADMAKVMAALDKDLGRIENLAVSFGL